MQYVFASSSLSYILKSRIHDFLSFLFSNVDELGAWPSYLFAFKYTVLTFSISVRLCLLHFGHMCRYA